MTLPHSHSQTHSLLPFLWDPSCLMTLSLPNCCPVKSVILLENRQPHDLVYPPTKDERHTSFVLPHSHTHNQIRPFLVDSPVRRNTVSLPKTNPSKFSGYLFLLPPTRRPLDSV